jgi:hypothetical protein
VAETHFNPSVFLSKVHFVDVTDDTPKVLKLVTDVKLNMTLEELSAAEINYIKCDDTGRVMMGEDHELVKERARFVLTDIAFKEPYIEFYVKKVME